MSTLPSLRFVGRCLAPTAICKYARARTHTHTLTHTQTHTHMDSQAVVEGQRVVDLAVSRDGARLVTVCADKSIKIFTLPSMLQV